MDPAQKPGMREQRFLALKAHGPFCTFREPLPDQPLHDARRIPQVHPERQPQLVFSGSVLPAKSLVLFNVQRIFAPFPVCVPSVYRA